jgi:Putative DNA-binding domain
MTMPALHEVQAAFRDALLSGGESRATAAIASEGMESGARLRIYRHHVFVTLTAALKTTYPVVCRLVDERFFDYAADAYIRTRPPSAPCLFEYGGDFPDFLAAFEPCRHLAYLPDVARLEWALNAAAHAEDATPLHPERLQAIRQEAYPRLVFRFDPAVRLLTSPWPVDRIWWAHQPGADLDSMVGLGAASAALEIRRVDGDPVFRSLDAATFAFRHALVEGRCLEAATADAFATDPGFDLTGAVRSLLADRVVTNVALAASGDWLED